MFSQRMETDNQPLISIITVTYNAQTALEETMQSVFLQTYPNIEYIIIDGKSQDGTLDIIKRYESQIATWLSEKDNGIYDAMNKGIRLAKGEIIGMINAGDYYEPEAVENIVNAFLKEKQAGIFHGNVNMLNEDGSFFKLKKPNTDLNQLYKGISLFHPTFFVHKSIYEEKGLYDIVYKSSADFDFALRNHLLGTPFYYLDTVIANFRLGGYSTVNKLNANLESREILYKNGYSKEAVEPLFHKWQSDYMKKRFLDSGYNTLRKILPVGMVNKIASYIRIK